MSALEMAREYHDSGTHVHFLRAEDCQDGIWCAHAVCLPCWNTFRNLSAHGCLCEWQDGVLIRS